MSKEMNQKNLGIVMYRVWLASSNSAYIPNQGRNDRSFIDK